MFIIKSSVQVDYPSRIIQVIHLATYEKELHMIIDIGLLIYYSYSLFTKMSASVGLGVTGIPL